MMSCSKISKSETSTSSDSRGNKAKRRCIRIGAQTSRNQRIISVDADESDNHDETDALLPDAQNPHFSTSLIPAEVLLSLTSLQQAPSVLTPGHDLADVQLIRRLVAMSSTNRSAHASLPIPSLFPALIPLNSLAIFARPQQLMPFHLNGALQNIALHERAVRFLPPFFYDTPGSLAMSDIPGHLFGSALSMHRLIPAGTSAQSHMLQFNGPSTSPVARVTVNAALHQAGRAISHGRSKSMNEASVAASASIKRNKRNRDSSEPTKRIEDGVTLFIDDDCGKLNEHQIVLRKQIELFRATQNEILSYTRGKNKPIFVQQVGLRCRHCSHISVGRRQKGSTYFPSNLMGIYQAAQNLSVEHLQSGLCSEAPNDVKDKFSEFALSKPAASGAGKKYWAEAGRKLGLIDTESGIRFASDMR